MPRLSYILILWLTGLLLAAVAGCDSDGMDEPAVEETVLRASLVQIAVQGALQETAVHLNNYGEEGEERENSWYRSHDSFIRLGASLGGGEFRFDIPESRTNVGPFRLLYYVRDLNVLSDSVTARVEPDSLDLFLTVVLPFEDEGREFKGHCLSETFGVVTGCLGSRDRIAPDLELDDAGLQLTVRPVVVDSSLAFEAAAVQFDGTVQAGGVCDIDLGVTHVDVCDVLTDYEKDLQRELERLAFESLNDPAIQVEIAAGLRPFLDGLGIGEVVYLERAGPDLVVGHRRVR